MVEYGHPNAQHRWQIATVDPPAYTCEDHALKVAVQTAHFFSRLLSTTRNLALKHSGVAPRWLCSTASTATYHQIDLR